MDTSSNRSRIHLQEERLAPQGVGTMENTAILSKKRHFSLVYKLPPRSCKPATRQSINVTSEKPGITKVF